MPEKHFRRLIALCCLLHALTIRAFAAAPVFYLGIEHGLSNNSVTCMFQDHKGFMWFGTYDGLNRYDGYNFKVFRSRLNSINSIPNNRIASITEDTAKRIWIGTRSGAARYDEVTSTFTSINFIPDGQKQAKKITTTVNQILTGTSGKIWMATDDGLLMYDNAQNAAIPVYISGEATHAQYQVMSVEYDNAQRLWVYVRDKGLYLYNVTSRTLNLITPEIRNGIYLKSDQKGNLWIGTDDGLFIYNTAANTFSKLFACGNRIVYLVMYDNTLYISSDGHGIFKLDCNTQKIAPLFDPASAQKLTSICTYGVLKDNNGRLWIGTLRGGINLIDPEKTKFRTITHDPLNNNSLVDNFVTASCEDAYGNLWIGTDGNGLSYWDRKKNIFTAYQHRDQNTESRSSNFVTDILIDYNNEMWTATWGGGIQRFNTKTHSFQRFRCINTELGKEDKNHFLLFQDKKKRLWTGTCLEGGLYCYDRQLQQFRLYDGTLKNILAMYEDNKGNLWAGDFCTLILIDQHNKQHKRFHIGYAVRSILQDNRGNFWIGTEGGGLLYFDPIHGKFVRFSETEGLSNNSILRILVDDKNNLWISTFNGISVFNTITKKFRDFSQADGLQSNQFNYNAGIKLRSGEFVFGGIKGLNIFYPDSVMSIQKPLTVLLTGLRVNNVPIQDDDSYITQRTKDRIEGIKLPYNKAVLSIDFVALNYSASDKIKYAYYLEGWDKGWNYVGKIRTANYTRLNEGSYIFHVKAIDAAGTWSEWTENLVIEILPPWYRSWWAYLFYISLACTVIYLYVRYRSLQDRQAYEIALARIETEKQKELNEKKLSFFTNISHEFRAPLTLIIDPVKEILFHPEKNGSTEGLHVVYRNARRLLSLVDQLLLFRKAETEENQIKPTCVNFCEFCHEVFTCFAHQAKARNIDYEFSACSPSPKLMIDHEKMEIVLFNLLSNALKFTPSGGKVTLAIYHINHNIEVVVSDTGCGIDKSIGNRLFDKFFQAKNGHSAGQKGFGIGLYLVNQFVQAHKGTLSYTSAIGKGTVFTFSFPVITPANLNEQRLSSASTIKPMLTEELIADLEADVKINNTSQGSKNKLADKAQQVFNEIVSDKKAILLVDDNAGIREYLTQIFAERFIVYESESGEDGLVKAETHMPDIIISDIVMTGMNGVEFCRKIKTDPELSHIPVILLTASVAIDTKLRGIECGAEDYITKPFEKELLLARVDNILKNRSTIQQYFLDTVTLRKNKTKVSASYRDFLDRCITVIEKEIDNENFSIKTFAREMGMSHSSLYKKVKSISGLSLNAFIRFLRLRKAAVLLLSTNANVNEAALEVGINDAKYFREQFNKLFGMNPSAYVKKYKEAFNRECNVISA